MKKAIICGSLDKFLTFPRAGLPFGFEQWGQALSYFYDTFHVPVNDFYRDCDEILKTIDVIMIEACIWERCELLKFIGKRPRKAIIIGVDHAPPNALETFSPEERECLLDGWRACDIIITVTEQSKYYIKNFTSAQVSEILMPVPVIEYQMQLKQPHKFNPPSVTMLHPVGVASQAFDPFLTCKLGEEAGFKVRLHPTREAKSNMQQYLDYFGVQATIEDWLSQEEYLNFLEACWGVIQLSGRPDLGRTVAMAAIAGIVSVAPSYRYQKFLYPHLVCSDYDNALSLLKKLCRDKQFYQQCVQFAQEKVELLSPKNIGWQLYRLIEGENHAKDLSNQSSR